MKMMKIPKQEYTVEFRELAVKRSKEGLTPGAVSKELGVSDQTLRKWVKAHDVGKLIGAAPMATPIFFGVDAERLLFNTGTRALENYLPSGYMPNRHLNNKFMIFLSRIWTTRG